MYFCPRYVLASLIPEPYWLRRRVTSSASQGSGLGPSGLGAGWAAGVAGLAATGAAGLAAAGAAGFAATGAAGFSAVAGVAGFTGSAAAAFAGSAGLAAGVFALAESATGGGTVGATEVGDGSADAFAPPDPAPSPGAAGAPAGEDDSGETGSVPLVSSGIPMPLFCAGSLVSWNYKFYQLEALTILCGGHAAL